MSLKLGSTTIHQIHLATSSTKIVPDGVFDIPSRSGTYDVKSYAFARASFEDNLEKRVGNNLLYYSNSSMSRIGMFAFAGTSISSINAPAVTSIGQSAFLHCQQLTSVTFPSCAYIGGAAFRECDNLIAINFPQCSSINYAAFQSCSKLTTVSLPTTISYALYSSVFQNCVALTSVNFAKCNYIGELCFSNCVSLTGSVSFSTTLSFIGSSAFYNTRITSLYGPGILRIHYTAFSNCVSLANINLPICTSIDGYAFYSCDSLTSITLPACTSINGGYAFGHC